MEVGFGPGELRCTWKELIQWAQRHASSHTQNAKFLDIRSLMFRLPAPLLQTCNQVCVAWLPVLPPWSSFLRATEMLSAGLRVLNIPPKLNNSLLSGCNCIFLSWQFKASCNCLDHYEGILVWVYLLKAASSWDTSLIFLTEFRELWDPSWHWVGWRYQWPPYHTKSVISKFTYQGHSSYCWYFKN